MLSVVIVERAADRGGAGVAVAQGKFAANFAGARQKSHGSIMESSIKEP